MLLLTSISLSLSLFAIVEERRGEEMISTEYVHAAQMYRTCVSQGYILFVCLVCLVFVYVCMMVLWSIYIWIVRPLHWVR